MALFLCLNAINLLIKLFIFLSHSFFVQWERDSSVLQETFRALSLSVGIQSYSNYFNRRKEENRQVKLEAKKRFHDYFGERSLCGKMK